MPHAAICFTCPACAAFAVCRKPDRGQFAECPRCHYRTRRPSAQPFGRRAWDTCTDSHTLCDAWKAAGNPLTRRKARLIACGVARVGFDWCHNVWFREAVEFGESEADGGTPRRTQREIFDGLLAIGENYPHEDWGRLAMECLQSNLREPAAIIAGQYGSVVAVVCHDLLPNPYVPVAWKPEWFTSTVRDLATHIYDARDFSAMPILADALMDAGCDHQLIAEHCRANRPHARGCWVVDGILGKQ